MAPGRGGAGGGEKAGGKPRPLPAASGAPPRATAPAGGGSAQEARAPSSPPARRCRSTRARGPVVAGGAGPGRAPARVSGRRLPSGAREVRCPPRGARAERAAPRRAGPGRRVVPVSTAGLRRPSAPGLCARLLLHGARRFSPPPVSSPTWCGTGAVSGSPLTCARRVCRRSFRSNRRLSERARPRLVFHLPWSKLGNLGSCGKAEPGQPVSRAMEGLSPLCFGAQEVFYTAVESVTSKIRSGWC